MVDNFDLISPLLQKEGDDVFYLVQIVVRGKDRGKGKTKFHVGMKKAYFIQNLRYLEMVKDEIIALCEMYGARAYINLAPKSFKKFQLDLLKRNAEYIADDVYTSPHRLISSVAGELKPESPRWVVDIDNLEQADEIERKVIEIWEECKRHDSFCIYGKFPTKSGLHLITDSFNLQKFGECFPDVDVHKNSMGTLLYYPKSLD